MKTRLKMKAVAARKPSTKINKGESFTKMSNCNKKIVGRPMSNDEYSKVNKEGTLERIHPKVKMNKKQRRKNRDIINKTTSN